MAAAEPQIKGRRRLPAAPPLPQEFQEEFIFPYDSERYPFLEAVRAVLQEPPDVDLSKLHETQEGRDIVSLFLQRAAKVPCAQVEALGPRGNPWNRRFLACPQQEPAAFAGFLEAYHDFLRTFVLDHLQTERVAFQALPTFRCHLPGCGAPGRPHRDEDYYHPQGEVNFWVPLTSVFGTNSLYTESRRGLGDFHPLEVDVGSAVRFYANQVWHYTVPNETGSTRISFDFRVLREQEWSAAAFDYFKLGGHYQVMTADGILPRDSDEMRRLNDQFNAVLQPPAKSPAPGTDSDADV